MTYSIDFLPPVPIGYKVLSVRKKEELTIAQVAKRFCVAEKPSVTLCGAWVFLIEKTLNHPRASEEDRHIFRSKIKDYENKNYPIIYIDESGFAHDMPRTHDYAPIGKRCYGTCDWHAKGRTNVIESFYVA